MTTTVAQDYCDWCGGPLAPCARARSQNLGLHLEDAWACTRCIDSGAHRLPPDGWSGPPDEWPGATRSVVWAATSPATGEFVPTDRRTPPEELAARFEELRARGGGYVEVRREADFPVLTLGFHGNAAVVHQLADARSTLLLRVSDSVATGTTGTAEVPIQDEVTEFASEFVHSLAHGWEVIQRFAVNDGFPAASVWQRL